MFKILINLCFLINMALVVFPPIVFAQGLGATQIHANTEDPLAVKLSSPTANNFESKKPSPLRPGDCIGILAPASNAFGTDIKELTAFLHSLGYKTKLAPSVTATYGYFAGTDGARANDINTMFKDPSVQAILCLRGGYGSARVLNKLDYDEIAKNPKLFIGYSDVTALHTALGQNSGIVTIHGPVLTSFRKGQYSDYTAKQFIQGLQSTSLSGNFTLPEGGKMQSLIPGRAEGKLVGGNLTLLAAAAGTPYELDATGCILLIEDIGGNTLDIDQSMQQLWQNGLLKRVSGIIFAEFTDCSVGEGDPTKEEVLNRYAKLANVPTIEGFPAGHGKYNAFVPLGVRVVIDADKGGTAKINFAENYAKLATTLAQNIESTPIYKNSKKPSPLRPGDSIGIIAPTSKSTNIDVKEVTDCLNKLAYKAKMQSVIAGKAEGKLVGGNLTMLATAVGTPYELKGNDGILFLECANESSYRVDRLMQQLWQNGLLQRVKGIVFGEFSNCGSDEGDFTTEEVLQYYSKLANIPTIKGFPSGHGMDNAFLTLGVNVVIDSTNNGAASLIFKENYAK